MSFSERTFGLNSDVEPNRQIDGRRVDLAVQDGDYAQFRKAMFPVEESLRDRIGRWVQRHSEIQTNIGSHFTIDDIVEETIMLAFDRYQDWHPEMFFGQWIETLIDPAIETIARDPEGELEKIGFQRSWNEI